MDGTVTREVLRSVLEEAAEAEAEADLRPKATAHAKEEVADWKALGERILTGERSRADYFEKAANPYGSEFSYDTTGQEEVVVWQLYFGLDASANRTIDHILQYMRPLPNWAYNGGAVAGDVANGGKWLVTAGTGTGDFGKMHYRAGLNQIPLAEWYRRHPDDLTTLEIAVGAMSGQMGNIDATGAPAIYFHALPHIMEYDAYSGDYGLGFFGSSLESSATLVIDKQLGPLCYLCDLLTASEPTPTLTERTAAPQAASRLVGAYTIEPRDAYRQRVYLEPLGAYLQADCGVISRVSLDLGTRTISLTFAPPVETPEGRRTYEVLRLRVDKLSTDEAGRPGSNFRVTVPAAARRSRAAFEIPATDAAVTVVLSYDA